MAVSYNSTANVLLCGQRGYWLGFGCNNNFAYWAAGTRTQFNIDRQTYVGLDVVYTALDQKQPGAPVLCGSSRGQQPLAARTFADQSAWMAEFRFHRNFYP